MEDMVHDVVTSGTAVTAECHFAAHEASTMSLAFSISRRSVILKEQVPEGLMELKEWYLRQLQELQKEYAENIAVFIGCCCKDKTT